MRDNNNMDSFYEESNNPQYATPVTTSSNNNNNNNNHANNNIKGHKRPATLDLNINKDSKKQRFNSSVNAAPVISSPDLQMLKLASPELEKIIMSSANLPTPTPSILYPTKVTTEQEGFAKGFEDALHSLHNNNNNNNNNSVTINNNPSITAVPTIPTTNQSINAHSQMSGGQITYTNLDSYPVVVKDEPQIVPQSPPLSPIDMDTQERIKLERKRFRNRVAASKCRKRKLERISKLEDKVKILKNENNELGSVVTNLRQHVIQLKKQVLDHFHSGCKITITGQYSF
uniref:Putative transcription factor ap-1 n=1 Tax=Corethrella appendiculata TaxID=1370023 RepID=U5EWF0_9DIPT